MENVARDLAKFLNELQKIDTSFGPKAGKHNYFRGAHPSVYEDEALSSISLINGPADKNTAKTIWEKACNTRWEKSEVWVHGDISSGNLLVNDAGDLSAVIDFGCMGIGDPACDLMIAWTLFDNSSRKVFQDHLDTDDNTWNRAKAWALWKCLQSSGPESKNRDKILSALVSS